MNAHMIRPKGEKGQQMQACEQRHHECSQRIKIGPGINQGQAKKMLIIQHESTKKRSGTCQKSAKKKHCQMLIKALSFKAFSGIMRA